jgi:hypothetical protein
MGRSLLWGLATLLPLSPVFAQDRDDAWVRQRVKTIKESDTTAWAKVPWTESLLEARRLAKDEGRPVFLFTLDGNLDTGRC